MKTIIDGYNLLFANSSLSEKILGAGKTLEEDREKLLHLLERYQQTHRDKITIVFDGQSFSRMHSAKGRPDGKAGGTGIEIIFSDIREKADEIIITLCLREKHPRNILLVTSDHAIRNQLKSTGIKVMDSADFLSRLGGAGRRAAQDKSPGEPRGKFAGISPAQAEEWRKIFGL